MLQQYDKAKKNFRAPCLRERRYKLALEAGLDPAELLAREQEQARLRTGATAEPAETEAKSSKPAKRPWRSRPTTESTSRMKTRTRTTSFEMVRRAGLEPATSRSSAWHSPN